MIKKSNREYLSLGENQRIIDFNLYNEKDHRKVFNKIVDKYLDYSKFPIKKIVYKNIMNRHYYQINNNVLVTIFEGVDEQDLGILKSVELKIRPSRELPKTFDMINKDTEFCKEEIPDDEIYLDRNCTNIFVVKHYKERVNLVGGVTGETAFKTQEGAKEYYQKLKEEIVGKFKIENENVDMLEYSFEDEGVTCTGFIFIKVQEVLS
ncbi:MULTISPECIES: hypothetical protein [Bacteria]|uniref:hypothetical protein n=1 Tax=Bacteria TaxID=2 RepID=UPI003F360CA4